MVEIDEGMAMLQHSRMEISVRRCGNRRFFLAASLSGRMISVRLRNAVLKPGFKFSVHKLEAGVRLCRIERNEEMLEKRGPLRSGEVRRPLRRGAARIGKGEAGGAEDDAAEGAPADENLMEALQQSAGVGSRQVRKPKRKTSAGATKKSAKTAPAKTTKRRKAA